MGLRSELNGTMISVNEGEVWANKKPFSFGPATFARSGSCRMNKK